MSAAKKATTPKSTDAAAMWEGKPRPRLHRLTIRNFRAIGPSPVTIDLNDIVVLVGPNNVGKSSILRAYEVVMQHGSSEGKLKIEDFPNDLVDEHNLPEIEVITVVHEDSLPGSKWIDTAETGEMFVRERWTWSGPGVDPKKVGWDVAVKDWHPSEGPWGLPGVAQMARPEPHRVKAFDSPEAQADQIVKLLKKLLEDRLAELEAVEAEDGTVTPYQNLLAQVIGLQKKIVDETKGEVGRIESQISTVVGAIFPGYKIFFDPRADDSVEKGLKFFSVDAKLRMGPSDGHQTTIEHQGSGARRTLLWAALRILSEERRPKDAKYTRPHLLLIDEPELCLHPDAIREACRVLYSLPENGEWQVMVTTHSPAFLDLSRNNTTIVRVERREDGSVMGTTVFQPVRAKLDDDDKQRLKMLNACDPYVAEFFFGGNTIVVEGDTEFTAFRQIMAEEPDRFKNIHLVRARGKATIVTLCKILNAFGTSYSVLHDSDKPRIIGRLSGRDRANPAWTVNLQILDIVKAAPETSTVRLVASVPNFEEAFFGEEVEDEKPYAAQMKLKAGSAAKKALAQLLEALATRTTSLPENACEWTKLEELSNVLGNGEGA